MEMDISFVITEENESTVFDIGYDAGGDFVQDDLDTSMYIGLFSNARANDDEVLVAEQRQGFWGKTIDDIETGSKIWLQDGRKTTENSGRILDFAEKSLQFLTDEELVKRVENNSVFTNEGIALFVEVTKLDNSVLTKKYIV